MKYLRLTGFLLLGMISMVSCSKDDGDNDLIKPKIIVHEIGEKEDNETVLHIGEAINFKASISDDQGLSQYSVNIHWGADHDHENDHQANSRTKSVNLSSTQNQINIVRDLTGEVEDIDWIKNDIGIIVTPDMKEGQYHFIVRATDQSGNVTESYNSVILEKEH